MNRKQLAVCAIFENVAGCLAEWLAYHRLVGVEHYILYDNNSTDDPARVIRTSPLAEYVTLIRWQPRPGQLSAYRHFIDIFAPGFEWAAFIGVDDFLLPLSGSSVLHALEPEQAAGAIFVQRRIFSPGPGPEPPRGLIIETYDRRAGDEFPANRHVRVVARCSALLDVTSVPHEFQIEGPVFDTAGQLAPNTAVQPLPCYRNLAVNHYCLGARDTWLARIQQECGTTADDAAAGSLLAELSQVHDDAIRRFAPAVRDLLGLAPAEPMPAIVAAETMPPPVPVAIAVPIDVLPAPAEPAAPVASELGPIWLPLGDDAQERVGGGALIFRDRSRAGEHWMAALRGALAAGIDPAFLMDDFDRIRDFPDAAEARTACDTALARVPERSST